MDWQVTAIIIAIVFLIILSKLLGKKPTPAIQYRIKGKLFTKAERSFFGVLSKAAGSDLAVFGKVRVADILAPQLGLTKSTWRSAYNRISSKHFDFVVCDPATLEVNCVIELNDKSHKNAGRAKRDDFIRKACESAGLRLIEIGVKRGYLISTIRQLILSEEVPDRALQQADDEQRAKQKTAR